MARLKELLRRAGASGTTTKRKPHTRRPRKRQPSQLAFTANHKASTASSILQSLLTLYGLVALMHGVVIPISDALAKPVEHAAYRQVFYIFMHGVGIGCILYLNSLISWHQRAKKRQQRQQHNQNSSSSSSRRRWNETYEIPMEQRPRTPPPPVEIQQHQQHQEDAGPVPPLATEEADDDLEEFPADPERQRHLQSILEGMELREIQRPLTGPAGSGGSTSGGSPASALKSLRSRRRRSPLITDLPPLIINSRGSGGDEPLNTPDSPFTPGAYNVSPITQSETGINLYLRLGAIVFGFGVMIHDGFKISEVIEKHGADGCQDIWFIPKQVIHLLFIMAQTYYVFKHHRVTYNTQLPLIRFMMVHLIVTNLCIWVKTVIYEIKVGLTSEHSSYGNESKIHGTNVSSLAALAGNHSGALHSNVTSCLDRLLEDGPSHKLGPYLYPCAVEYGLICAAICFKVFSNIGDTKVAPYGRKMYPEGPRFTACHKSHKGLFLGLLIMICVLVPWISLQLLRPGDKGHRGLYMIVVLGVECAVLVFTSGMAVVGTAKTVRHLRLYKVRGNEAFDVNLLFVGLAGIMCYNLFVSISVGSCAVDSNIAGYCPRWTGYKNLIAKIGGLKSLLEVAQSVAQTLFIMQGIQRRITLNLVNNNHKPGRGITIGLLIANLAMWIEAVFEAKRSFAADFPEEYFGAMAWSIAKYIFLPLIIFYRFHSSVCLSEIWVHSYKMPKKRRAES